MEDANTERAVRFMGKFPTTLVFNPLHRLEVRNGLRLRVFRKDIERNERAMAIRQIESNLENGLFVHLPLPWTEALRKAEELSSLYAEDIGSRSADTLHIAASLLARIDNFLTFDERQRDLARAVKLVVNP